MKITDFLADVMLDVKPANKGELLQLLSARTAAGAGLDAEEVMTPILKREELGSTGVGNGVALPHARLTGLKGPFGVLARLRRAIDFEAIDDQPVDIVFLLLLPESDNGEQRNALACAARALRNPEVLKQIRGAADRDALVRAITEPGTRLVPR
jgi:PTS system nitrogen regulatory IIA component